MKLGSEPPLFGRTERLYSQPEEGNKNAPRKEPPPSPPTPAPPPQTQAAPAPVAAAETRTISVLSTLIELAGIAAITTGGFLVAPWLGCMILGVALIVLGVALGD